ncbi:MAG: hypothetical protein R3A10_01275 [Caldilineaceae bacterium]
MRRLVPITSRYHGEHFFIRRLGFIVATPLLLVLVIVETTDLVFALDSIPAIFAVTQIRSSSTRRTSLPSWGCVRSTSCWPMSCRISVSESWTGRGAGLCGRQDAHRRHLPHAHRHVVGRHCRGVGRGHRRAALVPAPEQETVTVSAD